LRTSSSKRESISEAAIEPSVGLVLDLLSDFDTESFSPFAGAFSELAPDRISCAIRAALLSGTLAPFVGVEPDAWASAARPT
jgi:hypothetical protein